MIIGLGLWRRPGYEGGNNRGDFCFTLDITDIATGWTETRSVKNKAQKWVFAAIKDGLASFPFQYLASIVITDQSSSTGSYFAGVSKKN